MITTNMWDGAKPTDKQDTKSHNGLCDGRKLSFATYPSLLSSLVFTFIVLVFTFDKLSS